MRRLLLILAFAGTLHGQGMLKAINNTGSAAAAAGIAFDAATELALNPMSGAVATLSHTITGSNTILWVGVFADSARTVVSATYNGNAMTLASSGDHGGNPNYHAYLYYIVGQSGTHDIVITLDTGATNFAMASASYTGANQTTQPDVAGVHQDDDDGGGTSSVGVTTVTNNSWMVGFIIPYLPNPSTQAAGAGTTFRNASGTTFAIADSNGPKSPAGAYTLTQSDAGSINVMMEVAAIRP